jgi:hypothetical protein
MGLGIRIQRGAGGVGPISPLVNTDDTRPRDWQRLLSNEAIYEHPKFQRVGFEYL